MAKMSPQEGAAKWAQRAAAASGDYVAGVERVSVSPGQAAASKYAKWQAGLQASGDKWRSRVAAVSTEEWKESVRTTGASRFAQGVQAKQHKMERFLSEFQPFQDGVTSRVRSMPDTTPEDRINRMVTQVRETAKFRRSR